MLTLLVLKIIIAYRTKNAIVNSEAFNKNEEANLYYLLPKALLKITSTAKVRIEENENTNVIKKEVLSQQFNVEPKIIGDNNFPIALKYKTQMFYNDLVSFTVGDNGLLQTINTKVKDETSTIFNSISNASKLILTSTDKQFERISADATKVSIKEYKKVEIIDPHDKTKNSVIWNQFEGNERSTNVVKIELGFKYNINGELHIDREKKDNVITNSSQLDSFKGIYSRPIVTNKFEITPHAEELEGTVSSFHIPMPCIENFLKIPLTRGHFIEKTNNLILTNGLITSNSITKPSELVGFISIPIDILKAIVSIPSQLLTFTINRSTQLANLEKQKGLLASEIIKNENTQLTRDLKLQQDIKATEAAIAASEKSIVEAKNAILKAVKENAGK